MKTHFFSTVFISLYYLPVVIIPCKKRVCNVESEICFVLTKIKFPLCRRMNDGITSLYMQIAASIPKMLCCWVIYDSKHFLFARNENEMKGNFGFYGFIGVFISFVHTYNYTLDTDISDRIYIAEKNWSNKKELLACLSRNKLL